MDRGLVHLHQGRADVFSRLDGLSSEHIEALYQDREGSVWIATSEGLDRFRDFAVATITITQGLSNNAVGSVLAEKDGSVWLATRGGLNRWDRGRITIPKTGSEELPGKLNGNNATSLLRDNRGRLWVPTPREFGYLENGRFIPLKGVPGGQILSIVQDSTGNVWAINEHVGLLRISPQNEVRKFLWSELGHSDHASVLVADQTRGGLWLGFFNGGIAYLEDGQISDRPVEHKK